MISKEELKWKLIRGNKSKIVIEPNIVIRPYTLAEIIDDIGMNRYMKTRNICTMEKEDFLKYDKLKPCKNISLFDIFVSDRGLIDILCDFITLFTRCDKAIYSAIWNEIHVKYKDGTTGTVNSDNLEEIFEVIRIMDCISIEKKYDASKATSQKVAEILNEFARVERERRYKSGNKNDITLYSICEAYVNNKHSSYKYEDIENLTIYQLVKGHQRVVATMEYEEMVNGIYFGTVDAKKIELEKIYFARELGE